MYIEIKKVLQFIINFFIDENYRYWHFTWIKESRHFQKCSFNFYKNKIYDISNKQCENNVVINIYDGLFKMGGLADRLKGILSTYAICERNNVRYKLFFSSPFNLIKYLEPNYYDWQIDKLQIKYDNDTYVYNLMNNNNSIQTTMFQEKLINKIVSKKLCSKQIHIYTNSNYAYMLDYQNYYHKLFKPTKYLSKLIDYYMDILNGEYISVSLRFMDIFGDFNETCPCSILLSDAEKEKLIMSLINKINVLYTKYRKKVLVNSDSEFFLNYVRDIPYCYIVPGKPFHIDSSDNCEDESVFDKLFIDFYLIANAQCVFLLKADYMYESGFPYAASRINNKKFVVIKI